MVRLLLIRVACWVLHHHGHFAQLQVALHGLDALLRLTCVLIDDPLVLELSCIDARGGVMVGLILLLKDNAVAIESHLHLLVRDSILERLNLLLRV